MARLVTKFKYLRPSARHNIGGYARYIATREGVEKIDDTYKLGYVSGKQKQLIGKILKDFPDSKDMHEYEDYLQAPNVGNASEFISRALEDNASAVMDRKTYADYIALRPRAERFGKHGLFTDEGVEVQLNQVSEELNAHAGNVWITILSLRREDAERLGFDQGARWRDMLRSQAQTLAENLKIPMKQFRWYAAFHNEGHHPHVHIIAYSASGNEGYLTKSGVENLRSEFGRTIFAQDLLCVYEKQTEYRNELREQSRELLQELVARIRSEGYENETVEEKLLELTNRLSRTRGKKQYGYLKSDVKALVCSIVDEIAKDDRIEKLYALWYEQREEVIKTYTQALPERIPLSRNNEFKPIRNAVIQMALEILKERQPEEPEEEIVPEEITEKEILPEPTYREIEKSGQRSRKKMWEFYFTAKVLLERGSENYNPKKAVGFLIESARLGNTVAKYRLGKLYLQGKEIGKNLPEALYWLEAAVKEDNQYAEYLLGKTLLQGEEVERDARRGEELLKRSAEQGNRYAAYTLGKALLDGDILAQDLPEAVRLLTAAADKGFIPAEYVLGKLLYRGEVVKRDVEKSLGYLEQASKGKNPNAAYLAGKIRLTEEAFKDVKKALRHFEIAAESGNPFAMYQAGQILIREETLKDVAKAMWYFENAAKQGNSAAEYRLGKLYLYGKEVRRDEAKAMDYLTAASEHGNTFARELLERIETDRQKFIEQCQTRMVSVCVSGLFQDIARILQTRLEEEGKGKMGLVDRKLRRQIEEKKQAQGLKHG
jgi:sel1 repeat